jgi:F0F1-type ATP synthase membrane subunit c/vacuolar-type H+-ATPase subunit K
VRAEAAAPAAGSYAPLGGFAQGIAGQQTVAGTAKKPRQFGVRIGYQF